MHRHRIVINLGDARLKYKQDRDESQSRLKRREIHEVAQDRAARRRDCCRHLIVGCTGIRTRRLRSQLPSQCIWPMRMGRSKSKLVPESYGPSRHLRGPWSVALLQVIAFVLYTLTPARKFSRTENSPKS